MATNLPGNPATYHPTISVPDPGDDRNAASVRGAFQYLIDNTAHLKQRADALDNDNPKVWAHPQRFDGGAVLGNGDEFSYQVTTARKVMLPLVPMGVPNGWGFSQEPPYWIGGFPFADTAYPIFFLVGRNFLPSGCTLIGVRAGVLAPPGLTVQLSVTRISYDTSGPNMPVEGTELTNPYIGAGDGQHVCSLTFNAVVDNAGSMFRIGLRKLNTGFTAALRWIELTYWDAGPRNF